MNTITKTAQPLSSKFLSNNSIACGQSDGAIIQVDILDITVLASKTWWYNKYYNNAISKIATMRIRR